MITFSIIQKSQLEGANRLDAEYYQPEFLRAVELIKSKNHKKLGDIISFLTDYHANGSYEILRKNVQLSENPSYALMVRAIDLERNNFEDDVRYVSEHAYNFLQKTKLYGKEIIIDKIGNAGEVFLMPALNRPVTLGMNLFTIRLKNEYDPAMVYTFLISKYGKALIYQRVTGTVPTSIDKESVKGLLIPLFSEKKNREVRILIKDHLAAIQESHDLYRHAENLLSEELGLSFFVKTENEERFCVVNFSDVKKSNRIDAEYFQPKFQKIISRIKNSKPLISVVENVEANFNPVSDQTYRYVELADINSSIGIIEGSEEILGEEAPSRAKRILKEDDVIVSSVEGSLEKVALVDKTQDGFIASNGFFQFRSKKMSPEVLLTLFKSIVMQWQLKQNCAGTILTAVPKETLNNMVIPVLPKIKQQKIANLVRKSHESRKKAKELLEEAKRKVEEMIESRKR